MAVAMKKLHVLPGFGTSLSKAPYCEKIRRAVWKRELLSWVNAKTGKFGVNAENFRESFENPLLLNAMVKSFVPKDIDLDKVNSGSSENHINNAMNIAEKKLKISKRVSPSQMSAGTSDEVSMCLYIASFREYEQEQELLVWVRSKLKPYSLNVNNFTEVRAFFIRNILYLPI
jgi:hypothetical protein